MGGGLLWAGGRGDRRSVHLGIAFLLLATSFTNRPLLRLATAEVDLLGFPALILSSLHFDAFLPYFFWRFVGEFPTSPVSLRLRRLISAGALASLALGAVLFAGELGRFVIRLAVLLERPETPLGDIAPLKPSYFHYSLVLGLATLALAVLLFRARTAPEEERRRIRVFVAGLAGMAPLFLWILADAVASWLAGPLPFPYPFYGCSSCVLLRPLHHGLRRPRPQRAERPADRPAGGPVRSLPAIRRSCWPWCPWPRSPAISTASATSSSG